MPQSTDSQLQMKWPETVRNMDPDRGVVGAQCSLWDHTLTNENGSSALRIHWFFSSLSLSPLSLLQLSAWLAVQRWELDLEERMHC